MIGFGTVSHPAFLFSNRPLAPGAAQENSAQRDMQALQKLLDLQTPAPDEELNITV